MKNKKTFYQILVFSPNQELISYFQCIVNMKTENFIYCNAVIAVTSRHWTLSHTYTACCNVCQIWYMVPQHAKLKFSANFRYLFYIMSFKNESRFHNIMAFEWIFPFISDLSVIQFDMPAISDKDKMHSDMSLQSPAILSCCFVKHILFSHFTALISRNKEIKAKSTTLMLMNKGQTCKLNQTSFSRYRFSATLYKIHTFS